MAEFCLDCWNKMNGTDDPPEKYILSRNFDLCEGCGEWKRVIVRQCRFYRLLRLFRRKT